MTQPRVQQLHQSGATTGQAVLWDGTTWAPGDVASPTTALVPLTTVNTSGDPVLVWAGDDTLVLTEVPI